MKDHHITRLLEETPFSRLSAAELFLIEAHAAACPACLRAYRAARAAAALLQARAAETAEPSPFFKTRVMAVLRERHLAPEPPPLLRWWQAARALVYGMAALVVLLAGLTLTMSDVSQQQMALGEAADAPEWVLYQQDEGADEAPPYDNVLTTIYGGEEEDDN